MIDFDCPHCKTTLRVPEECLGQSGKCNHCGKAITILVVAPPIYAAGSNTGQPTTSHDSDPVIISEWDSRRLVTKDDKRRALADGVVVIFYRQCSKCRSKYEYHSKDGLFPAYKYTCRCGQFIRVDHLQGASDEFAWVEWLAHQDPASEERSLPSAETFWRSVLQVVGMTSFVLGLIALAFVIIPFAFGRNEFDPSDWSRFYPIIGFFGLSLLLGNSRRSRKKALHNRTEKKGNQKKILTTVFGFLPSLD